MSQLIIRRGLEKQVPLIVGLPPQSSWRFENVAYTPDPNTPIVDVKIIWAKPDNSTLGDGYYREQGIFQFLLEYPIGTGVGTIGQVAQLIRDYFYRNFTISESGIDVVIAKTPAIYSGYVSGDRYKIPVSIEFYSQIFV